MFKAELKSDVLKGIVNAIAPIAEEVKFHINADGISMRSVDATHVAMISLDVDKSAFDRYEADDTEIGLELDKVKDILKLAGSGETISMEQDSEHARLVFRLGNITRRMNLIDTSSLSDPKTPKLELPATIVVPAFEIQRGIKASGDISDHLHLTASGETFEMSCDGDTDAVNLVLDKSSLVSIDAEEMSVSAFSTEYFSNLFKAIPSDTNVTIGLGSDKPVKIAFGLADATGALKYTVRYMLAPRIEND